MQNEINELTAELQLLFEELVHGHHECDLEMDALCKNYRRVYAELRELKNYMEDRAAS